MKHLQSFGRYLLDAASCLLAGCAAVVLLALVIAMIQAW